MKFIGMFENTGIRPQFSNKRSRSRDTLNASASEADATALPRATLRRPAFPWATRGFCKVLIAVLIASILLVGPALAQDHPAPAPNQEAAHYAWADVLRVDPVYDEVAQSALHEECYEEQVIEPAPDAVVDNGKRTGSAVLGAIIGGIIGNRFGKGDGRKAATAAGAVAGGVVGNNLAAGQDNANAAGVPRYTTQRRCHQVGVAGNQRRVIAYDVEYRYRGEVYSSRLNYDPGDRMRVRVSVTPAE
jgi:uncharacterized protein YcfJ